MKILLSGVSGIGKTTLAKAIAEKYHIPFIVGSSKVLWRKLNISSHKELIERCEKDVIFALDFQYRLLEYRKQQMSIYDRYVSDRGPLDNLVYFLLQISHKVSQAETVDYITACREMVTPDITQVYMDFDYNILKQMGQIESDGARITNEYYQLMVASVFDMVIGRSLISTKTACLTVWNFEKRLEHMDKLIIENYGGRDNSNSLFGSSY